jgi:hypothetical protein
VFECLGCLVFEWCLNDLTFVSMCRYTPLDPVVEEYRALRVAENAAMAVEDALVRPIFIVHVGGTRCVTSRTDNIMKIHARITLTVEFIRGYLLIFLLYV